MLSQKDIDRICEKTLAEANLTPTCRAFVEHMASHSTNTATAELEQIIRVSISKCLHAVLNQR